MISVLGTLLLIPWSIAVIFGGTYQSEILTDVYEGGVKKIAYMGDVNGDGIDDFSIGYYLNSNHYYYNQYLYYGNDGYWDPQDRILLCNSSTMPYHYPAAFGIGDFNGDGYDDFLNEWVVDLENYGYSIYLGSSTFPDSPELIIDTYPWTYLIDITSDEVSYGDFNGDGYSDMVTSDHTAGLYDGVAGIWFGKANANGTLDLRITPPAVSYPGYQFGWYPPAVGDYNGDGCDDVAFCSPRKSGSYNNGYHGWVHVYAGNAQLTDTTVANEDPVLPGIGDQLTLLVSPNPVTKADQALSVIIKGAATNGTEAISIEIFNIKGQSVYQETHDYHSGDGKYKVNTPSLNTGIYLCKVASGKQTAISKFSVIK